MTDHMDEINKAIKSLEECDPEKIAERTRESARNIVEDRVLKYSYKDNPAWVEQHINDVFRHNGIEARVVVTQVHDQFNTTLYWEGSLQGAEKSRHKETGKLSGVWE
jgi:RNA-splicing ligase RtcB